MDKLNAFHITAGTIAFVALAIAGYSLYQSNKMKTALTSAAKTAAAAVAGAVASTAVTDASKATT